MQCLILAAGKGSRLRDKAPSKVLLPLFGVALIERVIRTAIEAGADEFYVVTGHRSEAVRAFLESLAEKLRVPITVVRNERWATTENGASVLAAREYLRAPFLLLMGDHLFEPALAAHLLKEAVPENGIALAVDTRMGNPLVDLSDVTQVRHEEGRILHIGKGIADHTGYDTGVFYCTPALFDALEKAEEKGDSSLSAAVRQLATDGRVRAVDVGGRFWIDVDSPAMFSRAEQALLDRLRSKPHDGPISRYLNRPLSIRLSRRLAQFPVTPNQISLFSFVTSVLAASLFVVGSYAGLLTGGILAQFASIVDGCDGEIARLKYLSSEYGGWLDAVLDRYADGLLLFALTWYGYSVSGNDAYWVIGFLAIMGSFLLSYTADKYDGLMKRRSMTSGLGMGLRMGRDVRVFLVFVGAILNQVMLTLAVIAVLMNLETIRRMVLCRNG